MGRGPGLPARFRAVTDSVVVAIHESPPFAAGVHLATAHHRRGETFTTGGLVAIAAKPL